MPNALPLKMSLVRRGSAIRAREPCTLYVGRMVCICVSLLCHSMPDFGTEFPRDISRAPWNLELLPPVRMLGRLACLTLLQMMGRQDVRIIFLSAG